jgi:hypothetical protein
MFDIRWARMHADSGSWHAIQNESKVIEGASAPHPTYCSREADGPIVDDLKDTHSQKGCESCKSVVLRILEAEAVIG